MKFITLTNTDLVATVSDEDYEKVALRRWYLVNNRNSQYAATCMNNTSVYMHHFVYGNGMFDHKDGNGLNNTRGNVRPCNLSLNAANTKKRSGTLSRFKGVTFDKRRRKWVANIMKNKRNKFLGYFSNEEDAAKVYDKAAAEIFGEFAVLNFPIDAIALCKVKGVEV